MKKFIRLNIISIENRKIGKLFLVILLFMFFLQQNLSCSDEFSELKENRAIYLVSHENSGLKSGISVLISSWFNNSENKIDIDATATGVDAQNWTWARNQEWCRVGDGSIGSPYLIENISINCGSSGSGIYIKNSYGIYFTIKNCSVTNSGSHFEDAGIKLTNTSNGTIINNNCSNNGNNGLILINCDFNTISDNTACDNEEDGINLYSDCDSNTISDNVANDNDYGIYLNFNCTYNTISNNTVNNNRYIGINLDDNCDLNILSNNLINSNRNIGIYLEYYCDFNTISGNNANYNSEHGISLHFNCTNNIISNNTSNYNGKNGICLSSNCTYNSISENTANYNLYGLNFDSSSYNDVLKNILIKNKNGCILEIDSSNEFEENSCIEIYPIPIFLIICVILAVISSSIFIVFRLKRRY